MVNIFSFIASIKLQKYKNSIRPPTCTHISNYFFDSDKHGCLHRQTNAAASMKPQRKKEYHFC